MKCPCGSGIEYKKCCKPFHKNKKKPKNALELMKSRYSAYVMGEVKYIIKTTHKNNPEWKNPNWQEEIKQFCQSNFKKLEILDFITHQNEAFVEFKAYIDDYVIYEKSRFVKEDMWLYESGIINPN